ncbi:MAG: aldolase [Clostridia bacterium]|nr:aldolase [Clostridia bacterium]
MSIKLMYITNDCCVARIAERSGVDRIFVDMEYIGKSERQGGMDTVQNHHSIEDVINIRKCIKTAELLVRCNPVHDKSDQYCSTEEEIERIVEAGADIIMLPYFKSPCEVSRFVSSVNGRAKTMLLFETPEAVESIDEILKIPGIDEAFVGLNDLSLGYGMRFMFEPLTNNILEDVCKKFAQKSLAYGFGGLASLEGGLLPGKFIVAEHYRLNSSIAILSRSFCNTSMISDKSEIERIFNKGINEIRQFEKICSSGQIDYDNNLKSIKKIVKDIVEK